MNKESSQIFHIKGVDGAEIHLLVDFSGQMLICQNNRFNNKLIPIPEKYSTLSRITHDLCTARSSLIQFRSKCLGNSKRIAPSDTSPLLVHPHVLQTSVSLSQML